MKMLATTRESRERMDVPEICIYLQKLIRRDKPLHNENNQITTIRLEYQCSMKQLCLYDIYSRSLKMNRSQS